MKERSESYQRAIDQVAILFPHMSTVERFEWWAKLGCPLTELTVHMPQAGWGNGS